jgi:hypothetical protein
MNTIKAAAFYNIAADVHEVHTTLGRFMKPVEAGIYSRVNSSLVVAASDLTAVFNEKPETFTIMTGYKNKKEVPVNLSHCISSTGLIDWSGVIDGLSEFDKVYVPRINKSLVFDHNRYSVYVGQTIPWFSAEKVVLEFVRWFIDSRCQWSKASFEKVYSLFNKADPRVPNLELEEELLHACREIISSIVSFIGNDDWCVYMVASRGAERLYVEKGEDYRITEWMREHSKKHES